MRGLTYRAVGVDTQAEDALLGRLRDQIRSTHGPEVLGGVGLFAGLAYFPSLEDAVLVASVDGVGTKTEVARWVGQHRVIGHDVVAHGLNDIAVHGARPLLFLDAFSASAWMPEVFEEVLCGITEACRAYGVALVGGETAQMPDVYREGAYDVVGCAVGVVTRKRLVDGSRIRPGDVLVGLASEGLHTNGYTLARRALMRHPEDVHRYEPELGTTRGEALLRPHRCYAPVLLRLVDAVPEGVTGMAHITGGGLPGNVVRILPEGCAARVEGTWPLPPIFRLIAREGPVSWEEMYRVFNMGIGLVVVVRPKRVDEVVAFLRSSGEQATVIGEVVRGPRTVHLTVPEAWGE